MVYCGRPAASCGRCRAKKRRCDKATPICGQCHRAGQQCPGYNDASSPRFRDETTRIINRARALKARRVALTSSNSPASIRSSLFFTSPSLVSAGTSVDKSISIRDEGNEDGEEDLQRGDEGKDRNDETDTDGVRYEGDRIEDVLGHDHSPVSDEMAVFINNTHLSWKSGQPGPLSLSPRPSSLLSPNLNDGLMPMIFNPPAPSENLHQLGISYFLANYVLQGSGPCPGFLNYTLDILSDPLVDRDMAQSAVRAAGLAGIASTTGTNSIMCRARASYTEAVERVNAALMDPLMTSNDSTIFAVIVLGLFETITCSENGSLEGWKHHINGAANLLMHRGTAQFRTKQGLQLFGEALSHVITLCSRYGQPVPSRLRFLRVELERILPRKAPSWVLTTTHIEVMDLYHHVDPEQELPFLPGDWEKLLSRAVELNRRLENLVAEIPDYWRFKTVSDPAANQNIVYHNTYHVYYNSWVAKIWNGIRACCIILDQAIYCLLLREGLTWSPHDLSPSGGIYTGLLQRVLDKTTEMRDGILASVPQMLGYVHHDTSNGMAYLDCSCITETHHIPASGAYFLLWYLFLAGSLPINTAETRAWVVNRLRAIRSTTGIQKAGYFADVLEADVTFQKSGLPMKDFLIPDF